MAAQRHVHLKVEVAIQSLDAVDHLLLYLGWVTARPQQRQNQRSELVPQRQPRKAHALGFTRSRYDKRGFACIVARGIQRDLFGQADNGFKQLAHVGAGFAFV